MKAITIWQPWAQLLAEGKKHDETRGWATKYRGPILIHAAKANHVHDILGFSGEPYPRTYFDKAGITKERNLIFGAIIGKAILVDCKLIDEEYREFIETMCPAEFTFGDFTVGRYAWRLEQPVLFKNPIPAAGKQRLWEYNGKLEEVPYGKAEKQ